MTTFCIFLRIKKSALVLLFLCAFNSTISATAAPTPNPDIPRWIERPWEWRYIIYITNNNWASELKFSKKYDATKQGNYKLLSWETAAPDPLSIPAEKNYRSDHPTVDVVLFEFDKDGLILSAHKHPTPLRGRLESTKHVMLAPQNTESEGRYLLANWFLGYSEDSPPWMVGICDLNQIPSPSPLADSLYLYGDKFKMRPYRPTTGCREWANQLTNPDRPYIDVTSYIPKHLDPDEPGTYVHPIIGWARWEDPPKPVIGKERNTWYCLHECPNGEAPGPIPDIQAWAQRHGWHAPLPPTRIPVFPDNPARRGFYPLSPDEVPPPPKPKRPGKRAAKP
ncbi:hypothetical protein ACG0Z6_02425 [Roseateles sp. BYS180W]|uniref:Uncharacterized protein n=1 Tax=Roseateles rivi TaxID=3299028 RepID=A0ABW7FRY8_9BURK